jgi:hypothetical protein
MQFKWILPVALIAAIPLAHAADTSARTYQLKQLKQVSAANENCKTIYRHLEQLSKKPIALQFNGKDNSEFDVKHQDAQLINHSYKILKQTESGSTINRVGAGSFELNNDKMEYVLQIIADTNQQKFKYAYPIIISNDASHCMYTAVLEPDQHTIASFKKNIQNGNTKNGADLTSN